MAPLIDKLAIHRRDEGVVAVAGADRVAYLHSLLSQDVQGMKPGDVADFLYLDAKGEHLAAGTIVVHAERVLLVVPTDIAADVADRLDKFRFMMQVEVTDLSGEWALASLRGPDPVDAPGARSQPGTAAPHGGGLVIRDRDGGVDLLGPTDWVKERVGELLEDSDAVIANADDWERHRILSGRPVWGSEITPGRRTQELGLLPTHVHLRKGCYPGQESIAKIYNLGRPRRALAVVESDQPITAGDTIGEGRRPGEVTSAAPLADGGTVALAILPLTAEGDLPEEITTGETVLRVRTRVGAGIPQPGA